MTVKAQFLGGSLKGFIQEIPSKSQKLQYAPDKYYSFDENGDQILRDGCFRDAKDWELVDIEVYEFEGENDKDILIFNYTETVTESRCTYRTNNNARCRRFVMDRGLCAKHY